MAYNQYFIVDISANLRTIIIHSLDGSSVEISQIQTTAWLDLAAPEDTKILLDLVNKTRELVDSGIKLIILVRKY